VGDVLAEELDVDHGNEGLAGQRWDCIKGGDQA
jgi:hypothetical protein